MSQTTLEAPERAAMPESNAEPATDTQEAPGSDGAEVATECDYEEELYAKLDRAKHLAGAVVDAASQGDDTSLDAVTSLGMTLEGILEPLRGLSEDLMSELANAKFALRAEREVDSNGHNGAVSELAGADGANAQAESTTPDGTTDDHGGVAEDLAPEDDPNATDNSPSGIHRDLKEAIGEARGRLNPCAAIVDAEARQANWDDGYEYLDLSAPHVGSIRAMLSRAIDQLDDCEMPLARLDRFHVPKRSGEFPTHIMVRGSVTPFHRAPLGALCETAAQLAIPKLQEFHGLIEAYVAEREAARKAGHKGNDGGEG